MRKLARRPGVAERVLKLDRDKVVQPMERLRKQVCSRVGKERMSEAEILLFSNMMIAAEMMAAGKFTKQFLYDSLTAIVGSYWTLLRDELDDSTESKLLAHGLRRVGEVSMNRGHPATKKKGFPLPKDSDYVVLQPEILYGP